MSFPTWSLALALLAACSSVDDTGSVDDSGNPDDPDTEDVDTEADTEADTEDGDTDPVTTCVDADSDGFGEGCDAGPDCDDSDAALAQELSVYADADMDGYVATEEPVSVCTSGSVPPGYLAEGSGLDCDDADADIYVLVDAYVDADDDGYALSDVAVAVCSDGSVPDGYLAEAGPLDCDDEDEDHYQLLDGYYDHDRDHWGDGELVQVCSGSGLPDRYVADSPGVDCAPHVDSAWRTVDLLHDPDGDGYTTGEATEQCIGEDLPPGYVDESRGEDCDGSNGSHFQFLDGYPDADADGWADGPLQPVCSGTSLARGYIDFSEGLDCDPNDGERFVTVELLYDSDGDSWTVPGTEHSACTGGGAPNGTILATNSEGDDCDDGDPDAFATRELTIDGDGDGFGSRTETMCGDGGVPSGFVADPAGPDCDDSDAQAWQRRTVFPDGDNDGYTLGAATEICMGSEVPTGWQAQASDPLDCADHDAARHREYPYWADADGDGVTAGDSVPICAASGQAVTGHLDAPSSEEDCAPTEFDRWYLSDPLYTDADLDGDATSAGGAEVCRGEVAPAGYTDAPGEDCDDDDNRVGATSPEIPDNGIDDDCQNGDLLAATDPLGIYVDPEAPTCSDTAGAECTADAPCCTVYSGLRNVSGVRHHLYLTSAVGEGATREDLALDTLSYPVDVHGGYRSDWTRFAEIARTELREVRTARPTTGGALLLTGLQAETVQVQGQVTLRHVDVVFPEYLPAGANVALRLKDGAVVDARHMYIDAACATSAAGGDSVTGIEIEPRVKALLDDIDVVSGTCAHTRGLQAASYSVVALTNSRFDLRGQQFVAHVQSRGALLLGHNAFVAGGAANQGTSVGIDHRAGELWAVNNLVSIGGALSGSLAYSALDPELSDWAVNLQDNHLFALDASGQPGPWAEIEVEGMHRFGTEAAAAASFDAFVDGLLGQSLSSGTRAEEPGWIEPFWGNFQLGHQSSALQSAGSTQPFVTAWLGTFWQVFDHTWVGTDPNGYPSGFAGAHRGPDQREGGDYSR